MPKINSLQQHQDFPTIRIDPDNNRRSIEGYTSKRDLLFKDLPSYPNFIVETDDEAGNMYLITRQHGGSYRITASSRGFGLLLFKDLVTENDFPYANRRVTDNVGLRKDGFFYVRDPGSGTLTKSFEVIAVHVPAVQPQRTVEDFAHRVRNTIHI